MKPILAGLLNGTKTALGSRSDPKNSDKALQSFLVALENAENYSKKIDELTHPEKVAETIKTPQDKLRGLAQRVDNAITNLVNAKPEELVPRYKDLVAAVGEEVLLGKKKKKFSPFFF